MIGEKVDKFLIKKGVPSKYPYLIKTFTLLLHPILSQLETMGVNIDKESDSKKLFFKDFVIKMLWGFIVGVDSLRQLSLELKTNDSYKDLELSYTPFSTLKDAFSRFKSVHFKALFDNLLSDLPLMKLPNINEMGVFRVIDGTLLPTLLQMSWTYYRKKSNAFKMHFSFDLNRMIPAEFLIKTGNSCERTSLLSMVVAGITYIADRGYFSFMVCHQIIEKKAFFILRCKENTLFTITQTLHICQDNIPECFKNLSDSMVNFDNDTNKNTIRLIRFEVLGKCFFIATNRFDLTTLQVIILYAYRWQIELFFKYLKRTMNGIHLFNHSENGTQIQFYTMIILVLLEIKMKQNCQVLQNINTFFTDVRHKISQVLKHKPKSPTDWVQNIAQPFYVFWKISKNWRTLLKNSLTKTTDNQLFMQFAET